MYYNTRRHKVARYICGIFMACTTLIAVKIMPTSIRPVGVNLAKPRILSFSSYGLMIKKEA
jgi:hypothetical protein